MPLGVSFRQRCSGFAGKLTHAARQHCVFRDFGGTIVLTITSVELPNVHE